MPSQGAAPHTPSTSLVATNVRQVETPAAARVPRVVTPDPLAPRIVNADEIRSSTLKASRKPSRSYGPPVSTGLPTAGYVKSRPAEVPLPPQPTGRLDAATAAALAMPADELERIHATDPVYPAAALRDHVEGWVELMFTITETGTVRDVEVVDAQPHGVFESAATDAVSAWRFRPRLANGQPVPRRSTVTLRFNVEG
jgi:TonB family protein